jgi:hypothetical protein
MSHEDDHMATVSLANTSANLSGKTAVLAEADQTITGLQTFSRGTSAPFAVNLNAAKVANLDADKLDGLDGAAYRVWTPLLFASGTSSNTALENLSLIDLPVLSVLNVLQVSVSVTSSSVSPVTLELITYDGTTVGSLLLTGTTGAGDLVPNAVGTFQAQFRMLPSGGLVMQSLASGSISVGITQVRSFTFGSVWQYANSAVTAHQFVFRKGVMSSGQLSWAWNVWLL